MTTKPNSEREDMLFSPAEALVALAMICAILSILASTVAHVLSRGF